MCNASKKSSSNSAVSRGSAAAEFVAVIWVLTLILMLTVELGMAMNARLVVTGAAREGARKAAIDGGNTQAARQAIERYLAMATIDPSTARITIQPGTASYGTQLSVVVEIDHTWRTPLVRQVLGGMITIRGEAVSRSEKVRQGT